MEQRKGGTSEEGPGKPQPRLLCISSSPSSPSQSSHVDRHPPPPQNLLQLPFDVMVFILRHLNVRDMPSLERCCRDLAQICNDDAVWIHHMRFQFNRLNADHHWLRECGDYNSWKQVMRYCVGMRERWTREPRVVTHSVYWPGIDCMQYDDEVLVTGTGSNCQHPEMAIFKMDDILSGNTTSINKIAVQDARALQFDRPGNQLLLLENASVQVRRFSKPGKVQSTVAGCTSAFHFVKDVLAVTKQKTVEIYDMNTMKCTGTMNVAAPSCTQICENTIGVLNKEGLWLYDTRSKDLIDFLPSCSAFSKRTLRLDPYQAMCDAPLSAHDSKFGVEVWDLRISTQRGYLRMQNPTGYAVTDIHFDDRLTIAASTEPRLGVWDSEGIPLCELTMTNQGSRVNFQFDRDKIVAAIGYNPGGTTLMVFDYTFSRKPVRDD